MMPAERHQACRLIDRAVECCEERNLAGTLEVPRRIVDLVVHLQGLATDEEPSLPRDTFAAHGQLLDLRSAFMPPLPPELRDEQPDEVPLAEELVPFPKAGAAR